MSDKSNLLSQYNFQSLIPGQNDKSFRFEGAGVVVIARGTREHFAIVEVLEAAHALQVAKARLAQEQSSDGKLFALIANVSNNKGRRLKVAKALSE